jgi:hypothetical protein
MKEDFLMEPVSGKVSRMEKWDFSCTLEMLDHELASELRERRRA